jgi:hypothetical protein
MSLFLRIVQAAQIGPIAQNWSNLRDKADCNAQPQPGKPAGGIVYALQTGKVWQARLTGAVTGKKYPCIFSILPGCGRSQTEPPAIKKSVFLPIRD